MLNRDSQEQMFMILDRLLLHLKERCERLVFYVIANKGPLTLNAIALTGEIAPYVNAYSNTWLIPVPDKLRDGNILVKNEQGEYRVSDDWQDVAAELKKPALLEDELLGLKEWLHPEGLVVSP